jgi:hypothetical protein
VVLLALVKHSPDFTVDWLLDGRKPGLNPGENSLPEGERPPMEPKGGKPPINT